MTRREKQRELFLELINYQLEPHGVTYNDVANNPTWYMDYHTTPEKEKEFNNYCVERIRKVLKVNKKQAELEASWFILQWGLTTKIQDQHDTEPINKKMKDSDSSK